jgi:hypothetical protein
MFSNRNSVVASRRFRMDRRISGCSLYQYKYSKVEIKRDTVKTSFHPAHILLFYVVVRKMYSAEVK